MYHIGCTEIWGGVRGEDVDACTSGVVASLYSRAVEGGQGGAIYYISSCSGEAITRVAIADVMGHGAAVSDISEWLYEALRARMNTLDGNAILAELNALTGKRGYKAMTTGAVVAFYPTDSSLYFSYAGHPPIFAYRACLKRWEAITLGSNGRPANLPLGAFADTAYDQELTRLAPGDRLFLYTDGLIEAPDLNGEPFGQERLLAALEEASGEDLIGLKEVVGEVLRQHTGGSLAHDDVTFMALEAR